MAKIKVAHAPAFSTADVANEFPRIPVRPPFILVYSPESWYVVRGRLVPMLQTYPLVAGVNQVSRGADGIWVRSKLDATLAEAGHVPIPFAWGPDGSYMQSVQTKTAAGQVVETYISSFSDAYPGDSKVYADTDAYAEWLESLVVDKKLPPCPVHRVRSMLETAERELRAVAIDHKKTPSAASEAAIERLTEEVKVLTAALGEQTEAPRTKAKKKTATLEAAGTVE